MAKVIGDTNQTCGYWEHLQEREEMTDTPQFNMASTINMAQCIGALSIEVNTGMKHSRGSILKLVQRRYGVKAKTKKGALEEMRALYLETTGREYGS